MSKTTSVDKKFEEKYFKGWFKGAVGNFSKLDLEYSKKWFWGWLRQLDKYVDVKNGKGKNVLEIGCSIGGVASLLKDRGFDVWASDVSEYAVKHAKELSPEIHFLTFDVQKEIPLKQKFDLIIAFEVVEHLRDPESAMKNMYNSLKKGGTLVFSTPYPYTWVYNDPTHINVRYPAEWMRIIKDIGLKNSSYHKFSVMPYFYRYNKNFHIILPFHIPIRYINTPIFYIGKKNV